MFAMTPKPCVYQRRQQRESSGVFVFGLSDCYVDDCRFLADVSVFFEVHEVTNSSAEIYITSGVTFTYS